MFDGRCLRRPYLFPGAGKDRGEKGAVGRGVYFAGSMCTGKRQTHIRNDPSSRTAVTGIDPYRRCMHCVRPFELFQV